MPKGDSLLLVGVAVFGLLGLLSLYAAWRIAANARAFQRSAAHATGVVTALREDVSRSKDEKPSHAYYPTITFQTPGGDRTTFTSDTAVDPLEYPVGESIQVLYDPEHPQKAQLDSFDSLSAGPITLGIFGAGFVIGALLVYFLLYREVEVDTPLFVASGFAVATALLFWGTWHFGREALHLRAVGVRTTGTVLAADAGPLIEYTTAEGRTRRFQSHIASQPPKYAVGDKVPLIYDPDKPSRAKIASFSDQWLLTALFGGFCLLCFGATVCALYVKLRGR